MGLPADQIATRLVFVQTGQVVQIDSLDQTIDQSTDLKLPKKQKVKPPEFVKNASKKVASQKKATETQQTFWGEDE